MFKNLKITGKIALSFAVMILVMLIGSGTVFFNMNQFQNFDRTRTEVAEFGNHLDQLREAILSQRNSVLYLLVASDRSVLKQYQAAKGTYAELMATLKSAASDNKQQSDLLGQLDTKFQNWSKELADKQISLMDHYLTVNEARAIEFSGEPALLMTEIDAVAAKLEAIDDKLLAEATENQASALIRVDVASWVSGILMLLIAVGAGMFLARSIAKPVSKMTGAMLELAEGNKAIDIPAQGQKDEIGDMAGAVQVFKDNMIKADRLAEEQRQEEAARAERTKRLEALCADFDTRASTAVKAVASASTEMQASSESMSATAEETTRQSAAVAAASEQASANVQTVASAAEELSSSISEIARQVGQASHIASGAVREAEQTNAKIQGLAEAANKIGEVVALITDIADQTNLLALNATIEAARAGDAGKGFAVVASEVKNLANQTAKATDEIGTQISGIQTATKEAVAAIESITKTISEIDEVASGIASAVEEQGAATQEIARNVEQAAAGTQEVSSNIAGVSQAANDTGAAAGEIRSAAGELSQQSEILRSEVDEFLTKVKAI